MGTGAEMVLPAIIGVGTGASIISSEMSRHEQKKASRAQRRIQQRQSQRERLEQIRQARVQGAQILQAGVNTGTQGASGIQGGLANVQTQSAGNISFLNQIESMQQSIQRRQEKAAQYAGIADTASALGNLALTAYSAQNPKGSGTGNAGEK